MMDDIPSGYEETFHSEMDPFPNTKDCDGDSKEEVESPRTKDWPIIEEKEMTAEELAKYRKQALRSGVCIT